MIPHSFTYKLRNLAERLFIITVIDYGHFSINILSFKGEERLLCTQRISVTWDVKL